MKFIFKERIEKVVSFDLYKEKLYYVTEDLKLPALKNVNLNGFSEEYRAELFIFKNFLVCQDIKRTSFVYDIVNEKVVYDARKSNDKYYFVDAFNLTVKGYIYASKLISDTRSEKYFFNMNDYSFIKNNLDYIFSAENGEYLFYREHKPDGRQPNPYGIRKINYSGETEWYFPLNDKYNDDGEEENEDLLHVIGVYENNVWFALEGGKLLALDIETGKLKHKLGIGKGVPNFYKKLTDKDDIYLGTYVGMDKKNGEIIGVMENYLIKVNLKQKTPERIFIDISKSMKDFNISADPVGYHAHIEDDYIYFCDRLEERIGVLDRKQEEVIWSYETDRDWADFIVDSKISDTHWYILTGNNILYIFEKEM